MVFNNGYSAPSNPLKIKFSFTNNGSSPPLKNLMFTDI